MRDPLPEWLAEAAADAIVILPDNITAEAHGNQWSFALTPGLAATTKVAEIVEFVRAIAAARNSWLVARESAPMLLYCWHDEQAGQLRLSLVSASHGKLPFGCDVVTVEDLSRIAEAFLMAPHHGVIPWSDLHPAPDDESRYEPDKHPLPVWVTRMP